MDENVMLSKIMDALTEINPEIEYDENKDVDNYFDEGLIDSIQVITLVLRLEELFNIKITADKVNEDNFKNKSAILNTIKQLIS